MRFSISIFLLILAQLLYSQEMINPNYSLKTPETLEVVRVLQDDTGTRVDLCLENRIESGFFCIDKNTYLITDKGIRLAIKQLRGLPHCPDSYKFRRIGEKVYFSLIFDDLPSNTSWFDISEECDEGCLSIHAITLDADLNTEINKAFNALDRNESTEAIALFENILASTRSENHGIRGSLFLNLIVLYKKQGNTKRAEELIEELRNSSVPRKSEYEMALREIVYL